MRVLSLFLSLMLFSASALAANQDLSARVAALQFDQSVLRNSVNDQLREQNARLNEELNTVRAQLARQSEAQVHLQRQGRVQFIVFAVLFVLSAAGACALPFYLAQRRQVRGRKEAESSARDLKITRELLEQMRGDFKAIQGKMREYRSEFDLRLAEMKLQELEIQRRLQGGITEVAAAKELTASLTSDPATSGQMVWRDEAASYRALCLAEPDEPAHRRKLLAALRQGLSDGADVSEVEEGLRECARLLEQEPEDCALHCDLGAFRLARAQRTGSADDLATAEAHWLEAERLLRGSAAYELVALYAQSGRFEEARKRLALARLAGVAKVEKLSLLRSDPQLAPLREQDWFQGYLQTLEEELAFS